MPRWTGFAETVEETLARFSRPIRIFFHHDLRCVNRARLAEAFEARCDIHFVAVNVISLDDPVAEIDADTEHQVLLLGQFRVALDYGRLDRKRILNCVYGTRKLYQDPVTCRFDDAPAIGSDSGVN